MNSRKKLISILLALPRGAAMIALLLACTSNFLYAQRTRAYYHEDLYGLRPRYEEPVDTVIESPAHQPKRFVAATANVNERVDDVLDSINRFNVTRKFIEGFTIQVYSGQNREEAMNVKKKLSAETNLNALLEYNQPKFRVRVGSYYSRLEAQKDLLRLKQIFSNAILVPEKILVR
ncbi:MAG: SPOR domain-containing protein [Cyclobacteriaceae bacterium]|nr:SPOR domain-containing protein [Cyclobacteriaceae bacterium]